MNEDHTRAKIVKAMTELLEILKMPPADSRFPIQVEIVQRRWIHWTSLKEQIRLRSQRSLLVPGDVGRSPDSEATGLGLSQACILLTSSRSSRKQILREPALDQDSDLHYSIESILNGSRDLGLGEDGVHDTRITAFGSPPENHYPFFLKKYQVVVEHDYPATQGA